MSGGGTNTVSTQSVPDWLQPYLTGALSQGQNLIDSGGPQYYQGQQVANLNPMQMAGIGDIGQAASGPNAADVAQQQNMNIESGAYLNPNTNPYLAGTLNTADQGVQNQIASQFAGSGRNIIGSAPVQSSAMNQLANEIYGGAYQNDMNNMVRSQAFSPSLDAGTYLPGQQMMQTGAGLQGQQQNIINADMAKYNYNQQLPENMLSWYSGIIGQNGSPFRTGNSSSSGTNNPWMTGAGAGIAGLNALSSAGLLGSAAAYGGGTTIDAILGSGAMDAAASAIVAA